jgi:Peptidase A4 family
MVNKALRSVAVAAVAAAGVAFAMVPASGAVTANSANHLVSHALNASTSTNWSGYALTGTFTSATGHWTVPTVSGSGDHFSSQWVGIDGFTNSNLIQLGTEADVQGGHATYKAWWEILPQPETVIPGLTIHPGDAITATLTRGGTSTHWRVTLTDNTTGQGFVGLLDYNGPGASVEWVEEATQVNGTIGTPPPFTTFSFTGSLANGVNPNLDASEKILLVQNGVTYSTPSDPSGGNAFSVSYTGP